MATNDSDISEMMQHLDEAREDDGGDECENCKLPDGEMRTEREVQNRRKQGVAIAQGVVTRCAECGEQVNYHNIGK